MTVTQTITTRAQTYTIDITHSEVSFQVRHLLTKVRGWFSDFAGTIHSDEEHPEQSAVSMTINAASVDTNTPDRDQHLRSADFFDVDSYPTINFTSSRVVRTRANEYDVAGTLTIHGVSKEITLPVSHLGTIRDPWGAMRAAFETSITINRREFGLTWNPALETGLVLVGAEVQINLSIEAIAK